MFKKSSTLALLFFTRSLFSQPQDIGDAWKNELKNEINRAPMHASYIVFDNVENALKGKWQNSPLYISLNGNVRFNWAENFEKSPADFYQPGFDDSKWDNFIIPATWEVNNYGYPIYTNTHYEFEHIIKPKPPVIPDTYNPVGSYRKKVILTKEMVGKDLFIHFGAVKSNLSVWINGVFAGYSEDSKLAAEFNISPFVKEGENTVAFQVFRWSDGTYLECQDMWRVSGITRDCYIYARNEAYLRDVEIVTELDKSYKDAMLLIKTDFVNTTQKHEYFLEIEILDNGKPLFKNSYDSEALKGLIRIPMTNPKKWTAETPYLYQLLFILKDSEGKIVEVIPQKTGFRKVEIAGEKLLLNGKPILIKGINRHESDPRTGQYVSEAVMEKDIQLLKQFNLNAIRTSHYPNDEYFYDLCDQYGIYVVDEANIESHGMGYDLDKTLANIPSWKEAHLQRCQRMLERDKNRPCVIIWSMGNEAGNGYNFYETYLWMKKRDASRPIQYERAMVTYPAESEWNTDIHAPMYPSQNELKRYTDSSKVNSKPLIMCEYAHAMGNSMGGLKEYWDIIRNGYPKLQGGFIWDMIDQAFYKKNDQGKIIYAYGGDYGPENVPTDENFMCNGIFHPDRTPNPHANEVKFVLQNILTKPVDKKGTIEIFNENFFRGLENIELHWSLMVNGETKQSGKIQNLMIEPRHKKKIVIPLNLTDYEQDEVFLNVHYKLINPEPLLEAGYEIAKEQFLLSTSGYSRILSINPKDMLSINQNENSIVVSSSKMILSFNRSTGFLEKYEVNKKRILENEQSLKPNFWRVPTDNDYGANFPIKLKAWKEATQKQELLSFNVDDTDKRKTRIVAHYYLGKKVDAHLTIEYLINSDGEIQVTQSLKVNKQMSPEMTRKEKQAYFLMKYGMQLILPKEYSEIKYYGRGPVENYSDRNYSEHVGLYEQKVSDQCYDYIRPQETGNKTDVRWYKLYSKKGYGIEITSDSLLSISVRNFSDNDLDEGDKKSQKHTREIESKPYTVLSIDKKQMGLGCIDSWGAWPLEKYLLPYQNYSYTFKMSPFTH